MRLTPRRYVITMLCCMLLLLVVCAAALLVGPVNILPLVKAGQWQQLGEIADMRLEEVLTACLVGASLAVSGVVFQALLRNPLAEPFILGISGGASLGVILAMLFLPAGLLEFGLSLGAMEIHLSSLSLAGFLMALLTIGLVYLIAQRRGRVEPYRLILTGVIVNAFYAAAIMLVTALSGDKLRNDIVYYLMGGIGTAVGRWGELALATLLIAGAVAVFIRQAKGFNLMTFGENSAASMGLNVHRHRLIALVAASVLAGLSVSLAGPIGFVGLIVPHVLRMTFGPDHRLLVPLSVFGGAIFLVVAHRLVQILPAEVGTLPVGVVTALCGVPFFILLMRRSGVGGAGGSQAGGGAA